MMVKVLKKLRNIHFELRYSEEVLEAHLLARIFMHDITDHMRVLLFLLDGLHQRVVMVEGLHSLVQRDYVNQLPSFLLILLLAFLPCLDGIIVVLEYGVNDLGPQVEGRTTLLFRGLSKLVICTLLCVRLCAQQVTPQLLR